MADKNTNTPNADVVPIDKLVAGDVENLSTFSNDNKPKKQPTPRSTNITKVNPRELALTKKMELENTEFERDSERKHVEHAQLIQFRRALVQFAKWNVGLWQLIILVIIFLQGFKLLNLEVSVQITLISTTTLNVFGFLYIVLKFVFPQRDTAKSIQRNTTQT